MKDISLQATSISGCYVLKLPVSEDIRGSFSKLFQHSIFSASKLETRFREVFFTISHAGVLRGMHVQLPPSDHAKVVYCVAGEVIDVVLDIRRDSPTFGHHASFSIGGASGTAIYIPPGLAHGFYVNAGPAIMMYHVSSEHDPARDTGIHWDSFGMAWPAREPIVSDRDSALPGLREFITSFDFPGALGI